MRARSLRSGTGPSTAPLAIPGGPRLRRLWSRRAARRRLYNLENAVFHAALGPSQGGLGTGPGVRRRGGMRFVGVPWHIPCARSGLQPVADTEPALSGNWLWWGRGCQSRTRARILRSRFFGPGGAGAGFGLRFWMFERPAACGALRRSEVSFRPEIQS